MACNQKKKKEKNHIMKNYPQLPNTYIGADQSLFRIYGNNFMLCLAVSIAQEKRKLLLFH